MDYRVIYKEKNRRGWKGLLTVRVGILDGVFLNKETKPGGGEYIHDNFT